MYLIHCWMAETGHPCPRCSRAPSMPASRAGLRSAYIGGWCALRTVCCCCCWTSRQWASRATSTKSLSSGPSCMTRRQQHPVWHAVNSEVAAERPAWRRGRSGWRCACRVRHDLRRIHVSVLVADRIFFMQVYGMIFARCQFAQFLIACTHQIAKGFKEALKFIISAWDLAFLISTILSLWLTQKACILTQCPALVPVLKRYIGGAGPWIFLHDS